MAGMTRIYVPADVAMLRRLAETGELASAEPVHMVTRALCEAHPDADIEDLEYTAFDNAASASAALLVHGSEPRRVVVSADVPDERVTERPGGTAADLRGSVGFAKVAAVHMDDADAAAEIAARLAAETSDPAAAEDHLLDWYAPAELQALLAGFGSSSP